MSTTPRRLVCIHGYSSDAKAFDTWKRELAARSTTPREIHIGNYISLSNEVTIKDIAEGLDRALMLEAGLKDDEDFDVIVHSTGMLVIRAWLATYPKRRSRLKHLIGLAPATWGSPLAHKGRGVLGSIFKGSHKFGPDFLEAGDLVLDGLELGSRFTWDLAHRDLFDEKKAFYGKGADTPYVFIFCGNKPYDGLRKLINDPGSDGTVRFSGVSLNSRKINVDVTRNWVQPESGEGRNTIGMWHDVSGVPLVFVEGANHGTIMDAPPENIVNLVTQALDIESDSALEAWCASANAISDAARPKTIWQQFVIRCIDERGDPVKDYSVTLLGKREGEDKLRILDNFEADVHAYKADESIRNFHVDLTKLIGATREQPDPIPPYTQLVMELTLTSGSKLVGYCGESSPSLDMSPEAGEVSIDLTPLLSTTDRGKDFGLFHPFTTTLVEIKVDREPLPLGGKNGVYGFVPVIPAVVVAQGGIGTSMGAGQPVGG